MVTYVMALCFSGMVSSSPEITAPYTVTGKGKTLMTFLSKATWLFGGEIGERIRRNEQHWLLRAVDTNPGILYMFRQRDRALPFETPVPWAGEFAGKYLISAVQACRMSTSPALREHVAEFVRDLIACQAEDGYLGPWPKYERLLGHWDLWGHYHCILGLLMWYDETGDSAAFECARRATDLICRTYLDGTRRPIDAGTPMINLSILHALGQMYRRTGERRYLDLMYRIVEDMQQDGDWLRKGLEGVPYYKLPGGGTRWESLHIVQGLVELYRITGEDSYKDAVWNLWSSIRDYDRHPSGAFSTNEQAFGSIYAPGSIETCCSVAWEALTIDILQLTGDPKTADELELTTWNQVLAAQHPSGSWWTYNTPLNGLRVPSFHDIRFQARPGTPELNCCSVNGPRGLGMLTEWAIMQDDTGIVINYYGPMEVKFRRRAGAALHVVQQVKLLAEEMDINIRISSKPAEPFTIALRIPSWTNRVIIDGKEIAEATPGTYYKIDAAKKTPKQIHIVFGVPVQVVVGQQQRYGEAAISWGPFLLAFDSYFNDIDCGQVQPIDLQNLQMESVPPVSNGQSGTFSPILLRKVTDSTGKPLVLCDFASAGAHGTEYRAWLPAIHVPPPQVKLQTPRHEARGKPGPMVFAWEPRYVPGCRYQLVIARDKSCTRDVVCEFSTETGYFALETPLPVGTYYWKVTALNDQGSRDNKDGVHMFVVDEQADNLFYKIGADGLLAGSRFNGDATPTAGIVDLCRDIIPTTGPSGQVNGAVQFNGTSSGIRFDVPVFPTKNYSFAAWVFPEEVGTDKLQQIFCSWCSPLDDPLRVSITRTGLFAGIEAGTAYLTPTVPLEANRWYHIAAVKRGTALRLYINGERVAEATVPENVFTNSKAIGVGFNPLFPGGEFFKGRIADFTFKNRDLSEDEIRTLAERK
ncbi:MAG TPA: glycoside hydrolase family 127 protein [Candidatus Hydrogenedentes bacterium]|nr:glycoside hydrolase family 127 protein [Candidatus Hydrogenedentota bacterium]HOL76189.1 glycoside hydrolase family 127 protein [Candidatus Hydrogenedentota bacterium]HPO85998.1 glycoside hydrolase family 127 protein [Candidatus Hydrogenedentota bacterium]